MLNKDEFIAEFLSRTLTFFRNVKYDEGEASKWSTHWLYQYNYTLNDIPINFAMKSEDNQKKVFDILKQLEASVYL